MSNYVTTPSPAEPPSGFLANRTVHLHPTLQCNLSCRHCYSSSFPGGDRGRDAATFIEAALVLWHEGYRLISLSGGEALLYGEIDSLLTRLKSIGFRLALISNGSTLRLRFLSSLRLLDGVAVSFDGKRETHNAIRANDRAFDAAVAGLDFLSTHGIASAAAVCVTKRSIRELPELAELAVHHGAGAIQLRPLVLTGRAREAMAADALDEDDVNTLVLLSLALQQELGARARVHCDLSSAQALVANRTSFASLTDPGAGLHALSSMVNPLVITEDGVVRPFTYDFPHAFDIGRAGPEFERDVERFKGGGYRPLAFVVTEALSQLEHQTGFVDWYDYCRSVVERMLRGRVDLKAAPAASGIGASA